MNMDICAMGDFSLELDFGRVKLRFWLGTSLGVNRWYNWFDWPEFSLYLRKNWSTELKIYEQIIPPY